MWSPAELGTERQILTLQACCSIQLITSREVHEAGLLMLRRRPYMGGVRRGTLTRGHDDTS